MGLSDNERLTPAIEECLRLFKLNDRSGPAETILRLRSLQEISDGVETSVLIKLAASVAYSRSKNVLEQNLDAHLAGPARIASDVA
jgi:hypothetical protein